jgi:hypothetical protein
MPRATWPLLGGRPRIEIALARPGRKPATRDLLADTGAGSDQASFEIALDESDCLTFGGTLTGEVQLGGAFTGAYPVYWLRVEIPPLAFRRRVRVVAVPRVPADFDGIAAFRFLNRFAFGNFGDRNHFGLEI